MPLQQGEVSLLTLFADVHTYLAPPTTKPAHDRFDRRPYLYLFHDALNKRGRVEIANNAGTPDQDAFNGYLDMARVQYSYKQPTLFTISADASGQQSGTPHNDLSQWHLPSYDPRNENKYMYKIHTLDLYFWTVDDANLFLDSLKRVLHPSQLVLSDVPGAVHTEHRNSMSPVVQQLENMAVTSHVQRNDSVSTTQSFPPPPPPPAMNGGTPVSAASANAPSQQTFAPVAYNPAAPAAPEQRTHREKTPPPPDAEGGTGLGAAVHQDHGSQFPGPPQGGFGPQQTSYMPGPPGMAQHPGLNRASTVASLGSQSSFSQGFAPTPQQATPAQDPNAHLYAQQPGTPGINRQSTYHGSAPTQQYASYPSATAPPGAPATPGFAPQTPGYAPQTPGYGPSATQAYTQSYPYNPTNTQHSMHQQLYIPEGTEKPAQAGPGQQAGKMDQRMDRLEKGVGKFLKRLDKKL